MSNNPDHADKFEQLRQQAEELVRQQPDFASQAPADILELIHELRIHQTELEIQNEELKRAQQELSKLHREFEDLYEFAPCGYVTLNAKGIITRVNLTGASLLGAARQYLSHSVFTQFIASGFENTFLTARQKAGETGEKQSIELPLKREKESPLWVRANIEADRDETGAVIQWRMALVDITPKKAAEEVLRKAHEELERKVEERTFELMTLNEQLQKEIEERKKVEEKLSCSERNYKNLFHNAGDAILIHDFSGRLIEANRLAFERLGYAREELLQMSLQDIEVPEYADLIRDRNETLNQRGHTIFQTSHIRRDRTIIPIEASSRIIEYDGKLLVLTIARDISERKEIETQLLQSQKMEALGRLAGGMVHDFNNLITAIISYANFVLMGLEPDSPIRQDVENINKIGKEAALLTRRLMTFSHAQTLHLTTVDLNAVIIRMEPIFRRMIGEDVKLEVNREPELWTVKSDTGQMELVLINLAINAKDAMPRGGSLAIACKNMILNDHYGPAEEIIPPGSYVMIEVKDTGVGMDRQTLVRIFDPFFTTKKAGKGSGLGLTTVFSIIKQSGGYIWVQSEPGQGASFGIYLPRAEGKTEPLEREEVFASKPKGAETVLVVEDDNSVRNIVRLTLQKCGYSVLEAQNAEEALRIAGIYQGLIHLTVTDIVMPGFNGQKLAEHLCTLRPEMRVLYMSGYSLGDISGRGIEIRDVTLIQKPFAPGILARKVREVLDEAWIED